MNWRWYRELVRESMLKHKNIRRLCRGKFQKAKINQYWMGWYYKCPPMVIAPGENTRREHLVRWRHKTRNAKE